MSEAHIADKVERMMHHHKSDKVFQNNPPRKPLRKKSSNQIDNLMASARSFKLTAQTRCVTPTSATMTANDLSQYKVRSSYNKSLAQFGSSEIKIKQMQQKIDEL